MNVPKGPRAKWRDSDKAASPSPGSGGLAKNAPSGHIDGSATAVIGLQWGDEGKGKIIDLIARDFAAVVRFNGGANAGHSVVIGGRKHALHLIPSGVFHPGVLGVIGNGVVVDPGVLLEELRKLKEMGVDVSGLRISDRAHVVMQYHKAEDALREALLGGRPAAGTSSSGATHSASSDPENDQSIGTTRRGIGPAYAEKAHRSTSIRVGDLLRTDVLTEKVRLACRIKGAMFRALSPDCEPLSDSSLIEQASGWGEMLRPYITDTVYLLHDLLRSGKSLLFEGANATLLDVDHGTYPFVTSSNASVLGVPAGSGVPGRCIRETIGVMKAYSTRVGGGPFPTELKNDIGNRIRERGREYGTTTGRPRRCGWLDLVAVRYSAMLNDVTSLAIMLLDVLSGFDELKVCTGYRQLSTRASVDRFLPDAGALAQVEAEYESLPGFSEDISAARARSDLPANARRYLDFIEEFVGVPIGIISVGPDREQTILD